MRSPIFGPYEVSRSTNASDNQLINLYPEIIETKQGKAVGALYSVPGLTKLATLGNGPVRGLHVLGGKQLFAVSGTGFYQLDQNFNATLIATVPGSGEVKFIDNGTQIALFIGNVGFVAPPGYFLTGGTIASGGAQYVVNDEITLRANDGSQVATAIALVTAVTGGVITSFTFLQEGSFPVKPTGFTQASTTGSGSGFTITAPTYTAQTGLFPIRMPYTNSDQPISCAYQDGFGVINQPGSNLWFQSDLLDLSVWDPLNFASASGDPDDVMAIAMIHREMWLIKQFETEVWYNAGTVGFTFARLDGVYMQSGIIAVNSLAQSNETLLWLAQTKTGVGIVVQTVGHALRRVSTHAIEVQIQKATPAQMMAATAFTYQQQGHEFYVLNVADNTWVYDLTDSEKAGIPLWHQRASFGNVSGTAVGASTSGVGPPAPAPPPPPPPPATPVIGGTNDILVIQGANEDGTILWGTRGPGGPSGPPFGIDSAVVSPQWSTSASQAGWLSLPSQMVTMIPTTGQPNPYLYGAFCCSRDGTIGGGATGLQPSIYAQDGTVTHLFTDPSGHDLFKGLVFGVSGKGELVIGSSFNNGVSTITYGFYYASGSKTSAVTYLKNSSGLINPTSAWGISKDFSTIVGSSNWYAALGVPCAWSGFGGVFSSNAVNLPLLPGDNIGIASRCSSNGGFIVGFTANTFARNCHPCTWSGVNAISATALSLTDQNSTTYEFGAAADCSDDGTIIGGWVSNNANPSGSNVLPAAWINGTLMVLNLPQGAVAGWVGAISGDGFTLAGGYKPGGGTDYNGIWWTLSALSAFSTPQFHRSLADNASFIDAEVTGFSNITVVGDFSNGNLYKLDIDALTDNGQPRKWVRSWRALPQPVESPVSFHKLRVDMETGNAVIDPNTDPQVVLRWSDDGGHTWSNEIFENAGKTGETAHRVQFRRLGATRRNHGLDRIFEISSTDVFPVAIVGADVDAS